MYYKPTRITQEEAVSELQRIVNALMNDNSLRQREIDFCNYVINNPEGFDIIIVENPLASKISGIGDPHTIYMCCADSYAVIKASSYHAKIVMKRLSTGHDSPMLFTSGAVGCRDTRLVCIEKVRILQDINNAFDKAGFSDRPGLLTLLDDLTHAPTEYNITVHTNQGEFDNIPLSDRFSVVATNGIPRNLVLYKDKDFIIATPNNPNAIVRFKALFRMAQKIAPGTLESFKREFRILTNSDYGSPKPTMAAPTPKVDNGGMCVMKSTACKETPVVNDQEIARKRFVSVVMALLDKHKGCGLTCTYLNAVLFSPNCFSIKTGNNVDPTVKSLDIRIIGDMVRIISNCDTRVYIDIECNDEALAILQKQFVRHIVNTHEVQ